MKIETRPLPPLPVQPAQQPVGEAGRLDHVQAGRITGVGEPPPPEGGAPGRVPVRPAVQQPQGRRGRRMRLGGGGSEKLFGLPPERPQLLRGDVLLRLLLHLLPLAMPLAMPLALALAAARGQLPGGEKVAGSGGGFGGEIGGGATGAGAEGGTPVGDAEAPGRRGR